MKAGYFLSIILDIAMSLIKIDNKYMIARLKIEKDRLETRLKGVIALLRKMNIIPLVNKPYENEFTLTGQNLP